MLSLDRALQWARAGYPCFPIHATTRRPHVKAWPSVATTDEETLRAWWAQWPDAVAARVTGQRSGDVVLDLDAKRGANGALWLATHGLTLPPGPRTVTRSGGQHVYIRHPGWYVKTRAGIWPGSGVDTRGDGGYVAIYGDPPNRDALIDMPPWLVEHVQQTDNQGRVAAGPGGRPRWPRAEKYARDTCYSALRRLASAVEGTRNATLNHAAYTCGSLAYALSDGGAEVWQALADVGELIGLGSEEIAATMASGWCAGGLNPMGDPEPPVELLSAPVGWVPPGMSTEPVEVVEPSPAPAVVGSGNVIPFPGGSGGAGAGLGARGGRGESEEPDLGRSYYVQMQRSNDNIRCNVFNARLVIKHDFAYADRFVYDEFQQAVLISDDGVWRGIRDPDITAAQVYMQSIGLWTIAAEPVVRAMELVADERRQHPVREWLNGLQWDGVERLSTWLSKYLGAEDTDYVRSVARMSLLQAVARIMKPGVKADCMTVLIGGQGIGKSSVLAALVPEKTWFHDSPPEIGSERMSQYLAGKWIVEFAELRAMSRADDKLMKSFLSSDTESYRRPYARMLSVEPRQCVFFGTTNESEFLRDPTGARRYWPVEVTMGRPEAVAAVRDQLWAEAVAAYRAGEKWWGDQAFELAQRAAVAERYDADPWEEIIAAWLDQPEADGLPKMRTTTAAVAAGALRLGPAQLRSGEARRVAAVMKRLGWADWKDRRGTRGYVRPG